MKVSWSPGAFGFPWQAAAGPGRRPWNDDQIIREELFSIERLEQHAASLAKAQRVAGGARRGCSLDRRLRENEIRLRAAYGILSASDTEDLAVAPAANWLVDNFHLIEAQLHQIRDDLPSNYYRQLPKLAEGPFAGYPRVFGIAWACVAHSDSLFDPQALRRFVLAYQRVEALTIGELWAVAITLRIVLVENLRRAVDQIIESREALEAADRVADQLLGIGLAMPDPDALRRRQDAGEALSDAFLVRLVKRLRDQDPRETPAMHWLEHLLSARGTDADQMVHDEHQRQGASNVTVRNIITSMRLIADVDWADFFEDVSPVDALLRGGSAFAEMDFATRDLYRSAVERLARGSGHTESEVARTALAMARHGGAGDDRRSDPGYYLVAGGRRTLERALGYRSAPREWPGRLLAPLGLPVYLCALALLTATVLALPLVGLAQLAVPAAGLWLFGVLGLLPAIDAAIAMVNHAVTRTVGATLLPGLRLADGVPTSLRTMVVVPSLLTSPAEIDALVASLEVHWLASRPGDLHFALLTDWVDADAAHRPEDAALVERAAAAIARLNARYPAGPGGARFLLLHRARRWSPAQGCWMGWERKRGKLHELNRLLLGASDTSFVPIAGQAPNVPVGVRYVVTLDSDTRLPRGAVGRLVGKMAHPLNAPRFEGDGRRVLEGYAVLQPRVTPSLPVGREGSAFQRVVSGLSGINAYDAVAADLYQDVFGAGSYAGKGIYDVAAFERALLHRVPDDALLSHDLFEGTFARSALVSDIEVVEPFPASYSVAAARNHRWARGDWQLLPWILGRADVETPGCRTMTRLGSWKMLDNLRRTLSAPASLLALVAGWFLPLPAALAWTAFVVAVISLPALLPLLCVVLPQRPGVALRSHLQALGDDLVTALLQVALTLTFLAHQAWLMLDAILRTLYRLFISHRKLLEWITAAQSEAAAPGSLARSYLTMSGCVLFAVAVGCALALDRSSAWWLAAPFLVLWTASPAIALWISTPPAVAGRLPLSPRDSIELRLIARRTWRYFETFVTADDNMLPPDNFQEDPEPEVAHRTSPTNIGLYLLSVVSAHDFGWLGREEALERLEATLATLARMPRFRGHYFNWYDTRDLRPLDPPYVSSVDSGNLAAHLIALANACAQWREAPHAPALVCIGVRDALRLAREALGRVPASVTGAPREQLARAVDGFLEVLGACSDANDDLEALYAEVSARTAALRASIRTLADACPEIDLSDLQYWIRAAERTAASWQRELRQDAVARRAVDARLTLLEDGARAIAMAMDFDFLLDRERGLLSIGYRADEGVLDPSCYDLLASEARLASFFAIAKNDVPTRHWFRLGRPVTAVGHRAALISWSGSMFEYLMPSLVMRAPAGSLLGRTSSLVVARQIDYGRTLHVPWGVSESAYSGRDLEMTYQYSNFGVPGLGLKRGLSRNVVIAPYATALAAMVDTRAAARNFARLAALDALGRFGFFEAIDYTLSRLRKGRTSAIVRAYMAHHQGMTIVALANVLFDGRMRAHFHAEPCIRATELLLQEPTPRDVAVSYPRAEEVDGAAPLEATQPSPQRQLNVTRTRTVQTQILSNGAYSAMVTSAGAGYSSWRGLAITRWRADATRDIDGQYAFLRDVHSRAVWSATYQPCGVEPDSYHVTFGEDRVVYLRRDGLLTTRVQVVVSPEDDAEVRRISITNTGTAARDIDVTTYSELALAPAAADLAHPAFSRLFVQTEYVEHLGALLATRRRRETQEPEVWVGHQMIVQGRELAAREYETDRARFLGRGRGVHAPAAIVAPGPLSNSVGTVLDPLFALRSRVRIPGGATVHLSCWTVVAASRGSVCDLLDKHHDASGFDRAEALASTQAQAQLLHLGVSAEDADTFQRLAGHVLHAQHYARAASETIALGSGPRSALWAEGISGDRPIVLLRISHDQDIGVLRELLRAHEFLRLRQLPLDLVILNEHASSYAQDLQNAIETAVRTSPTWPQPGGSEADSGIFVLRSDLISDATRGVLSAAAHAVFVAQQGSLAAQLARLAGGLETEAAAPAWKAPAILSGHGQPHVPAAPPDLEYFNGLGGFAADGREYEIHLQGDQITPAPWINVIANAGFGCQVSAEGAGYTWACNSRENQLTPWSNDAVADPMGEVLYVHDQASNECWTPTRAPQCRADSHYSVRHGFGYSVFEHSTSDLVLTLLVFVAVDDPIKICRLRVRDRAGRQRRLAVTAYVEWVLGTERALCAPFVNTEMDGPTGALLATRPTHELFASRVAFMDLRGCQSEWTGDRLEFIGRNGRLDAPAAIQGAARLSGRTGGGLDACGALRTMIEVAPNGTGEAVFLLGQGEDVASVRALVRKYRALAPEEALAAVRRQWQETLGAIQVRTPDRALDLMLNGWLLYQTLACRTWARSAFYQASGAYGFRDQLQDAMALVDARPDLTRAHLLRAAARQYPEGDVQHWWLPTTGQGVRTRISDDRLWLPFVTAHYVERTGDVAVLDEQVPFLEGAVLDPGVDEAFTQPGSTSHAGSLREHCARALDASLALGPHGLPLFGTGDWNDGMNRVGMAGRGESVWLGWFLHATLSVFAPLVEAQDAARAARWLTHAAALRDALDAEAWDGDWYRRGYFDDGTPLGSADSEECRIDSIAQSWSVLSGGADPLRAEQAMASVVRELIRPADRLALLFTPPFDRTAHDPGYIKAYPPGLRENGGQYTHAAAWCVFALAELGQGEEAAHLLALLNPVNLTATAEGVQRYAVEPYVVAADVYSVAPHVGRGGWTWYTGAAGWLYRAGVEALLGVRRRGAQLSFAPCIPPTWPRYELVYTHRSARYEIVVENPDAVSRGVVSVVVDGVHRPEAEGCIALEDDGETHQVLITLGASGAAPGGGSGESETDLRAPGRSLPEASARGLA